MSTTGNVICAADSRKAVGGACRRLTVRRKPAVVSGMVTRDTFTPNIRRMPWRHRPGIRHGLGGL